MSVADVEMDGGGPSLSFCVLGQVTVIVGDEPVPIGGPGVCALLMLLLVDANRVVSIERIIDELWDDEPPKTARTIVHGYVSRLRRVLREVDPDYRAARIVTQPPGYQLRVDERLVDVFEVRRLLGAARGQPPQRRAELLRAAEALWRGPKHDRPPTKAVGIELAELRMVVTAERIEADLELGRHAELVGELRGLVREHPFYETFVGQLMRSLFGAGHRAGALECYLRFQRRVVGRLGIDPGPRLRELHERMLRDDPSLGADVAAPGIAAMSLLSDSSTGSDNPPHPAGSTGTDKPWQCPP